MLYLDPDSLKIQPLDVQSELGEEFERIMNKYPFLPSKKKLIIMTIAGAIALALAMCVTTIFVQVYIHIPH